MKKGLILLNIGTPQSPEPYAVKRYLAEFLMDKRVIDLPWLMRFFLVYGLILPFRTQKSAHAYRSIWMEEGSPLLVISNQLIDKLTAKLSENYQVVLGMRYGSPSIKEALTSLQSLEEIIVLPLYPQFASASSGSSLEKVLQILMPKTPLPSLKIISSFYNHPAYIHAQLNRIKPFINQHDHLLFSYHGIPERHIQKSSCTTVCKTPCPINSQCYRSQCYQTSQLIAQGLELKPEFYTTAFQSRLGKTPWIKPFTDEILKDLASRGIKKLLVACPSFVTDCLETIEEIGIRAQQQWQLLGGQHLTLVPALNADDTWVDAILRIIR